MAPYEVIVVGAGWCGLVAAKTYLQCKPDARLLIIDNAASIGGVWCRERLYPYLTAEAHHGLFEYSDLDMPLDGKRVTKAGTISGEAVHDYLHDYATKFELHERLRLQCHVASASRHPSARGDSPGQLWHLKLAHTEETLLCEKLIVATGLTTEPFVPDIPNRGFTGQVLHAKELGKGDTVRTIGDDGIRSVLVYGGSKSAFDATYMLLQAGKHVEWIVRRGFGGPSIATPLKVMGRPALYLNNSRLLASFSPNPFARDAFADWLHRSGPGWLTRPLVRGFWRLITRLLLGEAQYEKSKNGQVLKPTMGLDSLLWSPATLAVMTQPELWKDIHEGTRVRVHEGELQSLDDQGAVLQDGTRVDADMVVMATGWKSFPDRFLFSDLGRLRAGLPASSETARFEPKSRLKWTRLRQRADAELQRALPLLRESPGRSSHHPRVEDDFHLYRSIIPASAEPDDRSLAYIGFLRTTSSPILYEAQALWAAAYLQGKIDLPPKDEREKDVALTNAWFRRRYLCGRKLPFALFDFLPYIDLLYRDLGLNSKRKGNPVSELFGVYRPRDFRGAVDEFLASRPRQDKSERFAGWGTLMATLLLLASAFAVSYLFTHLTRNLP